HPRRDVREPRVRQQRIEVRRSVVVERPHSQGRSPDALEPEGGLADNAAGVLVVHPDQGDPHQAAPRRWSCSARLTKASTKVAAIWPKTGDNARPRSPPAIS